ncbi:MAG: hypothetical protein AAB605_03965 [Patescibacteria group bacterium]
MKKTVKRTHKRTEFQELSEFIRDHMVTKTDLEEKLNIKLRPIIKTLEVHTLTLAEIKTEVRDIRRRLEVLEEQVKSMTGYSKEIDHLLDRVAKIEEHLGLRTGR